MSDGSIKVTDRRMFTEDGELRDEFRSLEDPKDPKDHDDAGPVVVEPAQAAGPTGPADAPTRQSVVDPSTSGPAASARRPAHHAPDPREVPHDLEFMDLVAALAEPITLFLGDAQLPGGKSAQDLERARFYIDLLQVLRAKTHGNLSDQEDAVLADLIYRLQLRYVEKKG